MMCLDKSEAEIDLTIASCVDSIFVTIVRTQVNRLTTKRIPLKSTVQD